MIFARTFAAALLITYSLATAALSAQTYPNRPVTMIVAFPPGGADDATARILQDPMQKALGQPIVIENVGAPPPKPPAPSPTATLSCCTRTRSQRA